MNKYASVGLFGLCILCNSVSAAPPDAHQKNNHGAEGTYTTYYIDSETGNDSNAGTSTDSAWKGLGNIEHTSFQAGDRLLFAKNSSFIGGTKVQSSGDVANPIVIGNYGEGALPRFSNPDGSWLYGNVFQITGSHIVVDGLSFAHCANSNVKYGPGMEERSREADSRILQVGAIYTKVGADYITIKNCEFTDCPIGINMNGQQSLITHNVLNGCNRFLCEPDWGPLGIVIGNASNEIAYNTGVNHVAKGGNYGGDGGFIELDDRYSGGKVHDVKIHRNKSFGNMGFLEVESHVEGSNIDVCYNLSKDYQSFLLMWGVLGKIENNTVIRTMPGSWVIAIGKKNRENSGNTFTVRNNMFVVDDGLQVFEDKEGLCQIIHENNLYFSTDSSTEDPCGKPLGPGELIADPKFVNSASQDYHLSAESPAIGKGAQLGYAFDIDNTPIPESEKPSIGAFEYRQINQKVLNAIKGELNDLVRIIEPHGSAKMRADISKDVAKFASGWKVKDCGDDEHPGLRSSYAGRKNVLVTHPLSTLTPCVLTKKVSVPEGKATTLQLSVTHTSPEGPNGWIENIHWIDVLDWLLVVKVDGREVSREMVNNARCKGGWADLEFDLTPYAGECIEVV